METQTAVKKTKIINPLFIFLGFLLFAITCLLIGAFLDLKISSFLAGASQED
jgi:hypothetical protein